MVSATKKEIEGYNMKNRFLKGLLILGLVQSLLIAKEKSMAGLAKEMANPLAPIWNLSFQNNYTTYKGDLVDGQEHINVTLFQPILPVELGNGITAFARPVFTLIDAPTNVVIDASDPLNPIVEGTDNKTKGI